uniref:Carboxylesterase type B domain-containing protein n=1 Tax=Ditylenchus dipsaci TaxID=166011 RepID=A0A915DW69_9BILA
MRFIVLLHLVKDFIQSIAKLDNSGIGVVFFSLRKCFGFLCFALCSTAHNGKSFEVPQAWPDDDVDYKLALKQRNDSFRTDINCLALNIYTPKDFNQESLLPVYVLVHGGNLVSGSSPDFGVDGLINNFVNERIVCVTINYRLGAYGFFNFKDEEKTDGHSMRGFYDVKMALEYLWCLCSLMRKLANPTEVKLFHQVVMHSGVAKTSQKNGVLYDDYETQLTGLLKCNSDSASPDSLRKCLASKTMDEIVDRTQQISPFGVRFTPPDGTFGGMVPHEFYNFDRTLANVLKHYTGKDVVYNRLFKRILNKAAIYFEKTDSMKDNIIQFFTDYVFTQNIVEEARRFQKLGQEVSLYKFIYKGELDSVNGVTDNKNYVVHGADVRYAYQPIGPWKAIMNSDFDKDKPDKSAATEEPIIAKDRLTACQEVANAILADKESTPTTPQTDPVTHSESPTTSSSTDPSATVTLATTTTNDTPDPEPGSNSTTTDPNSSANTPEETTTAGGETTRTTATGSQKPTSSSSSTSTGTTPSTTKLVVQNQLQSLNLAKQQQRSLNELMSY